VLRSVLAIHKLLHILVIVNVYINARQLHKIYMLIIVHIFVSTMIIAHVHLTHHILILYLVIVYTSARRGCMHRILIIHVLAIVSMGLPIISQGSVCQAVQLAKILMLILTHTRVLKYVLMDGLHKIVVKLVC
jgi:hypothetical protein